MTAIISDDERSFEALRILVYYLGEDMKRWYRDAREWRIAKDAEAFRDAWHLVH